MRLVVDAADLADLFDALADGAMTNHGYTSGRLSGLAHALREYIDEHGDRLVDHALYTSTITTSLRDGLARYSTTEDHR